MRETIKAIIKEYREKRKDIIQRDIKLPKSKINKVVSVIGIRRCGKTTLLFDLYKKTGSSIFFPLDDDRIYPPTIKTLQEIIKIGKEIYPNEQITFFFDEIQEIENWEVVIKRLAEGEGYKVYLTGSSSKLLSKEIATQLRGRSLSVELFPLSFKEYLKFKDFEMDEVLTEQEKALLLKYLDDYLLYGGFPEVVLEDENKEEILREYLRTIIFRDIVERHNIKNIQVLKLFIKFLINSHTKKVSINKLTNYFKSVGVSVGKNTLYEYLGYLNDCYFVFPLKKFSYSLKEINQSLSKPYVIDGGFISIFNIKHSKDKGKYLENAVFVELRRRGFVENENLFYYEDNIGEVDFLIKEDDKVKYLINVCYELNFENYNREVKKFVKIGKKLNCKNLILITFNDEDIIKKEGLEISVIPFWKY
ncbi:ATP-binding protein [Methanococcus aeolicus]|uniref:ATP-binding protein n=1 Tax=Methanococcus aeolicus TaxID=42879 RepID=UPI0021C713C4|nr:ATP-binding protein [Methanococcus aeolicus]UXM84766.1 ATP-binding protein [Methanococcus aeolicus]